MDKPAANEPVLATVPSAWQHRSAFSVADQLRVSGRNEGLQRLSQWVERNGALTLTRKAAAEIACLEPHHFSKVFRRHVGQTFQAWRRRYRIAYAITALEKGAVSLAEVVHRSGYRDRRAFERAVKRLTGTTPGCIRRSREVLVVTEHLRKD